jgi:hypothetical protein
MEILASAPEAFGPHPVSGFGEVNVMGLATLLVLVKSSHHVSACGVGGSGACVHFAGRFAEPTGSVDAPGHR